MNTNIKYKEKFLQLNKTTNWVTDRADFNFSKGLFQTFGIGFFRLLST